MGGAIVAMLKVIVLNFLLDVYMWGLLSTSCYRGNVVVHILEQIYTTHVLYGENFIYKATHVY